MRFSTRTRYGLRFLLRLAQQSDDSLVQLGQVAREENISSGYLEQIVRALKPIDVLFAVRGSGGGYRLARPASRINLAEVFARLEGEISPVSCLTGGKHCERQDTCSSRLFWHELDEHVRKFLRERTLQDILDAEKAS